MDFVEGYTGGRAIASTRWTRRGRRPWRVWTLFVQEPGELGCGRRGIAGPCREGEEPKPVMNASKQSDPAIVAMKPTNKAGSVTAAESVEPRVGTEGNVDQQSTHRTQTRARVSQALGRVRQAATNASTSNTRGGSRVPESGPLGSVRGARSNVRSYRDSFRQLPGFGRIAYPLHGEVTDRDRRGRKSHCCRRRKSEVGAT